MAHSHRVSFFTTDICPIDSDTRSTDSVVTYPASWARLATPWANGESIWPDRAEGRELVLLSAAGMFDQAMANRHKQNAGLLLNLRP